MLMPLGHQANWVSVSVTASVMKDSNRIYTFKTWACFGYFFKK
jgi:hypothetical protein